MPLVDEDNVDDEIGSSSCFRFNTGIVVVVVSELGGIIFGINANGDGTNCDFRLQRQKR